jgi:cyclomaltodextrinase / maltogenic alpha-amylase / neopullulanase
VVYYGDEVGMWGADDPTDRKPMVWDDLSKNHYETQCISQSGAWCFENPQVKFSVEQDKDMLATYKRLIAARKENPALRRGNINTNLQIEFGSALLTTGTAGADATYLWGYERNFGDKNYAYFVSNQNTSDKPQKFLLRTQFGANKEVTEVISGKKVLTNAEGKIAVSLARDRAVLYVSK